jgi:predicted lysophospholipase L1 biosynthesis ABC-type transport system permease subunit
VATSPAAPARTAVAAVSLKLAAHRNPVNTAAVILYAVLGLLGAIFALGLGYKVTGLFPGR